MGTGSSILRNRGGNNGFLEGREQDVIIEMKPRRTLGGSFRTTGSLTRGSFSRKMKGASLRSVLSVDLDNPEVEKIRKEFEMFRMSKENEITDIQKRHQKLESENKRLRGELQASQKTCTKLRQERDTALEAVYQALERASSLEQDRDKIQRQFKIFRETKESELQNLLRQKQEVELKLGRLTGYNYTSSDDITTETMTSLEPIGDLYQTELWGPIESEPSIGSTTQLQHSAQKTSELPDLCLTDGASTYLTKDEWANSTSSSSHVLCQNIGSLPKWTLQLYLSHTSETVEEVSLLLKLYKCKLQRLCEDNGYFLSIVSINQEARSHEASDAIALRTQQIAACSVFLAFLANKASRYTVTEFEEGHLNSPGARSALFFFKNQNSGQTDQTVTELTKSVLKCGKAKIVENYQNANNGAQLAYNELVKALKIEADISDPCDSPTSIPAGEDEGCHCLRDPLCTYSQTEAVLLNNICSVDVNFDLHYSVINQHLSTAGPLPPLLVLGEGGSGRSLLLSKWVMKYADTLHSNSLVFYHTVDNTRSSSDVFIMLRKITTELVQQVNRFAVCNYSSQKLLKEFPNWLERVSSRKPGGIIIIIDGIDKFELNSGHFQWLMDPLPVDTRLIISLDDTHCPADWRVWPTIKLDPLDQGQITEIFNSKLSAADQDKQKDEVDLVVNHCVKSAECSRPLFVTVASELSACSQTAQGELTRRLNQIRQCHDTVQLYVSVLDCIEEQCHHQKLFITDVLRLILVSRYGLAESEIFNIVPKLSWSSWIPACTMLKQHNVLIERMGLLTFKHSQARQAVELKYCSDACQQTSSRLMIVNHFFSKLGKGHVTFRVSDELPWQLKICKDSERLLICMTDFHILEHMYKQNDLAELLKYWLFLGYDKPSMAEQYYNSLKSVEYGSENKYSMTEIASMYELVGRFLQDLGILDKAVTLLQRALEVKESTLDPDDPSVALTLHHLGTLYTQWGKYNAAESLFKQALDINKNVYGSEHLTIAKTWDALSVLYQAQNRSKDAESSRKQAGSIRRRLKNPQQAQKSLTGLDELCKQTQRLAEVPSGVESVDRAKSFNELGILALIQNKLDVAEAFFKRSLSIRETLLSPDHIDCAQSLNYLASINVERKRYPDAVALLERALDIRMKHLPADHRTIITTSRNLCVVYKKLGKLNKAETLYKQLLESQVDGDETTRHSYATTLADLGVLYSEQKHYNEAEPLFEQSLTIYQSIYGLKHQCVGEVMKNMALLKYDQGEFESAAQLYRDAMDMKEMNSVYHQLSGCTEDGVRTSVISPRNVDTDKQP